MNQEIHLGRAGQVFVHEPVAGIPAEPITLVVRTQNGSLENATIGDISSDRLASRLAEDAGIGASWLTVLNTDGITAGRRYLVGEAPSSEWVIVTKIHGPRVFVRRRLGCEFGAGSRFRSGRVSVAVNPAWQRTQARQVELGGIGLSACTLRWSYSVDGRITHAIDHADLVFTPRAEIITPAEVDHRHPNWAHAIPSTDEASEFILEAHDLVRRDAARANVDLNNGVQTRWLVALRARMIALEQEVNYGRAAPTELEVEQARYQRLAAELWKELHRPPIAHTIVDEPVEPLVELRRWLETCRTSNVAQWKQLQLFQEHWQQRFEGSSAMREAAARLLRLFISSRALREMREAVLRSMK